MYIDRLEELKVFCGKLGHPKFITVDTEFIRERTFYPQLEVIQIASENHQAVIDFQKIKTLDPLRAIFLDSNILKIFHAGGQDMEIFCNLMDDAPQPIFDTQIAAAFLGYGMQIAYGRLVEDFTGTILNKQATMTDWSKRPLHNAQIQYALNDVTYLIPVYKKMSQKLETLRRLPWVFEECYPLQKKEKYAYTPLEETYKRVKGTRPLKPKQLAILRELAAWRENECRKKNLPKNRVVRDEILTKLSKLAPQNVKDLKNFRNIHQGIINSYGESLIQAVQRGLKTPPANLPSNPKSREKLPGGILELLQVVLRAKADEIEIAPGMIASNDELAGLISEWNSKGDSIEKKNFSILQGWRYENAGEELLCVLRGDRSLKIDPIKKTIKIHSS